MKKRPPIALVVHGHFYQPPRENPWTDEVPREPTAAPFPNWNARINAECYRANAYARIYGPKDDIASIVNNYASMSFDLGPTLARWLDRHDAQVVRRMREGDDAQRARLASGGAMAQVWGHPIAPLLNPHDLRTQILWGQFDFRRRFGRDAAGMWLPETAASDATLAALIDAGIAYTILAPEQIESVRPPDGDWQPATADTLDTGRPYRFLLPDGSGRGIALAIFDGPLSRDLAFGTATRDAASFLEAMRRSAERSKLAGKRLVLAASDGELYGHHKKFADLALAYAVTVSAPAEHIDVTNLGAFLADTPPTWEARLRPGPGGEGTAWSCAHGLGRWLRDCGCRMHDAKGSSQAWRAPLRQALDHLRDRAAAFFEDAASELFTDPWQARDAYGQVADDDPETRKNFLRGLGRPSLRRQRNQAPARALLFMEMQRSLLLMYASCAWFFDDIAGPEAAIAMRRAAHAMDVWKALGGKPPARAFTAILAEARSNQAKLGNGADAFARACRDRVLPPRPSPARPSRAWPRHPPAKATCPASTSRWTVRPRLPATKPSRARPASPGGGRGSRPPWPSRLHTTARRASHAGWEAGAWDSMISTKRRPRPYAWVPWSAWPLARGKRRAVVRSWRWRTGSAPARLARTARWRGCSPALSPATSNTAFTPESPPTGSLRKGSPIGRAPCRPPTTGDVCRRWPGSTWNCSAAVASRCPRHCALSPNACSWSRRRSSHGLATFSHPAIAATGAPAMSRPPR